MSKKTRKHIRPVSLVMALAIIVTLSGFIVLATNPGGVQAQEEDCSAFSPEQRDAFEAFGGVCQDDTSGPPPPPSVPTVRLHRKMYLAVLPVGSEELLRLR